MKKVKGLTTLKARAWKVFSKFIRERDNYTCFTCNKRAKGKMMAAGHLFDKHYYSGLYFDEDNVHAQCMRCNRFLHGNLHEYIHNYVRRYGQSAYDILFHSRHEKKDFSQYYYLWVIDKYSPKEDKNV